MNIVLFIEEKGNPTTTPKRVSPRHTIKVTLGYLLIYMILNNWPYSGRWSSIEIKNNDTNCLCCNLHRGPKPAFKYRIIPSNPQAPRNNKRYHPIALGFIILPPYSEGVVKGGSPPLILHLQHGKCFLPNILCIRAQNEEIKAGFQTRLTQTTPPQTLEVSLL